MYGVACRRFQRKGLGRCLLLNEARRGDPDATPRLASEQGCPSDAVEEIKKIYEARKSAS